MDISAVCNMESQKYDTVAYKSLLARCINVDFSRDIQMRITLLNMARQKYALDYK